MTSLNSVGRFKRKYLDFRKEYINVPILKYFNRNGKKDFRQSIKIYFPYISNEDILFFEKYIMNSNIEYSNRIVLNIGKEMLDEYISTLSDDKIVVDIVRLNFTKNFIYNFDGKIKKYSTIKSINTNNYSHFRENNIYFYNYGEILNKKKFLNKLLKTNIYYKYLLHQDIHNSIINPILNAIMLSNYYKYHPKSNSVIFQLKDITQIYKFTDKPRTCIEMLYFIQEYFIYDKDKSDAPIDKKIHPYLLIKIGMNIKKDCIQIYITY